MQINVFLMSGKALEIIEMSINLNVKSENDLIGLFLLVATLKFLNIVKDMATF